MKNSEKAMDNLKDQAQDLNTIKGGKHQRVSDVLNAGQEREFGGGGGKAAFSESISVERNKTEELK